MVGGPGSVSGVIVSSRRIAARPLGTAPGPAEARNSKRWSVSSPAVTVTRLLRRASQSTSRDVQHRLDDETSLIAALPSQRDHVPVLLLAREFWLTPLVKHD